MEQDPSLQRLVVTLNASLKLETSALQATYEKWRAGQVELHEHKKLLDEELEALRDAKQQLAADRATFERRVGREWGPARLDPRRRVVVRVGGQSFQTTVAVLTRDRFSLLAAMAAAACAADGGSADGGSADEQGGDQEEDADADSRDGSATATATAAGASAAGASAGDVDTDADADEEDQDEAGALGRSSKSGSAKPKRRQRVADTLRRGAYGSASEDGREVESGPSGRRGRVAPSAELFLDRDWWLFRHILAFLRSGPEALPSDSELLRQLYVESAYLRLQSLRTAIERRLVDRRLPQALLDPEFAAAPLTRDAGAALGGLAPSKRHGGTGGGLGTAAGAAGRDRAAAKAGEALAWARWARGGEGSHASGPPGSGAVSQQSWGVAPAEVPGPLSGAMGGVRNAAALFAGAELDAEVKGSDGAVDVDGMGVDLEALVGAMERTRRRAGMAAGSGGGAGGDAGGDGDGAGGGYGGAYGPTGRGRGGGFEPLLEAAAAAAAGAGGPGVGSAGWWSWRDDLAGLASGDEDDANLGFADGY